MNKFVKGALIFTGGVAGGFVLCGVTTINFVVKSDTFRTALKNKISEEVTTFLYGENNITKKKKNNKVPNSKITLPEPIVLVK